MTFLHGIEHLNLPSDFAPVNDIVTAVIALVGTADGGALNTLTVCTSEKDDAQFGTKGTIPEALRAIRSQDSSRGGSIVLVVKVKADTDDVQPADIVGTVSPDGTRTGLKLFETALSKLGYEPMIYIAPRYSALTEVINEFISITDKSEAMAYIDSPDAMTYQEMIEARAISGEFNKLTSGQKLLYPHFIVTNPDYDFEQDEEDDRFVNVPMSAYMAGLRSRIDLEEGWHVSSSNHTVRGVEALDVNLTFGLGDLTSEVNQLNAKGVTTAVNMLGRGIVEWGNYTAGFPAVTTPDAFECVRRTRAIMKRAIEQAVLQYIDRPLIQANIDLIRNTVNQYLNTLVSQGKIVAGQCAYRAESNPSTELAVGHITFDVEFTPSLPMQRLTFTYKIDVSALSSIS